MREIVAWLGICRQCTRSVDWPRQSACLHSASSEPSPQSGRLCSALSPENSPLLKGRRTSNPPSPPIAPRCNCPLLSLGAEISNNVPQRPPPVLARRGRRRCLWQSRCGKSCSGCSLAPTDRPLHRPSSKASNAPPAAIERASRVVDWRVLRHFASCCELARPELNQNITGARLTHFPASGPKCRTRRRPPGPHLRRRCEGFPDRGFVDSRAAYPWCPGGF